MAVVHQVLVEIMLLGAVAAERLADVTAAADVIFTVVTDDAAMDRIAAEADAARPGTLAARDGLTLRR